MKTRLTISILILAFSCNLAIGQYCEEFDRNLFQLLPADIPDKINCRDTLEKRQGWWIIYKVRYNPMEKPDVPVKVNLIESYTYGKYKDDIKVGDWVSVINVQPANIRRKDNYYYAKDTFLITSGFADEGWNESSIYYNSDSTIIKSASLAPKEKFPICIDCDMSRTKDKECLMTYREKRIKEFPFDEFDFEFYRSFCDFSREKWIIDDQIRKNKKVND